MAASWSHVQKVSGSQPLGSLELCMEPPVLIPRPETEHWTLLLAEKLRKSLSNGPKPLRILDLCSGSGCIGLCLSKELGQNSQQPIYLVGLDILPQAVHLAKLNARRNRLKNTDFRQIDIFANEDLTHLLSSIPAFDIVVCNPPYVREQDWHSLDRSVKDYESPLALIGVHPKAQRPDLEDGLAFYWRIKQLLPLLLRKSELSQTSIPRLVMEVGEGQAGRVAAMFEDVEFYCQRSLDYAGIERTVWVYER
ncbi:MAG: hypothetical protein CYPHOPRED_005291 [Cyphobasidiales sp. Tagirdzhanova-0007]|nr:MAG: hypothetical protein CYPHOPRED_005291 [Cyphobasidiales sp. Tagirdzhanova-0007]